MALPTFHRTDSPSAARRTSTFLHTGNYYRAGALVCCLICMGDALAEDQNAFSWKYSGFGTLGAVYSSEREGDFSSSILRTRGAGRSGAWSPDVDSRLGAQIDVEKGNWSGVLQVVSEQGPGGSFAPRVEWANIKYQLTPEFSMRVGRIALPMFLGADSRKVGYTIPWIRTPVEVYGALPLSSSDGVDLNWRWSAGEIGHATQVFFGSSGNDLPNGLRLRAKDINGISHTIERNAVSARVSAASARLDTGIGAELFSTLRAFGTPGNLLADRYGITGKRVNMISAGLNYDPGKWFVSAEWGRTRTDSLLGNGTAAYVGAGMRIGALTPYVGYARVRADMPTTEPGLPLAGMPPQLAAIGAQLNTGINSFLAAIPVQSTCSAGLRWDATPTVALKMQIERVRPRDGSNGTLINTSPNFRSGQAFGVASVALDFVF